jgi:ketosteroid isomerase-like protein
MSESSAGVVRGMYDAFGRGDVAAILGALDENVEWSSPENLPHGGAFRGRDGVGQFFAGMGEKWESLSVEVDDVLAEDDRVVVLATIRGRLRAMGADTGYGAAHAWTLRGESPVRFVEYVDAPLSLRAAP